MSWVIILLVWMAVTTIVVIPYVKQIENLENERDKIFSYIVFAVGGPAILLSGIVVEVLEGLGIDFDEDLW